MPKINYHASDFATTWPASLHGHHDFTCSWAELVWSAITVGKVDFSALTQHGSYSMFEIIYRTSILYSNLRQLADDRLEKSDVYLGLDPSEKGAISYFLGLTLSKLIASRLFGVPWLMHLDVFANRLTPTFTTGSNERPDLVGLDAQHRWYVLESKGRTGNYDNGTLSKAKVQTRCLRSIGGATPHLRAAVVAHFGSGTLGCRIKDPEGYEEGAPDLSVTPTELLRDYSARIDRLIIGSGRPVINRDFGGTPVQMVRIEEVDCSVGRRSEAPAAPELIEPLAVEATRGDAVSNFLGEDGVYIELGPTWSEENMRRSPVDRRRN